MIETFEIDKSEMCVRCRDLAVLAARNVFPLIDMQQESTEVQTIAYDYNARGLNGPLCRRCGRLPVVTA